MRDNSSKIKLIGDHFIKLNNNNNNAYLYSPNFMDFNESNDILLDINLCESCLRYKECIDYLKFNDIDVKSIKSSSCDRVQKF